MEQKLVITKNGNACHIETGMTGQELYEALVCLIGFAGANLADPTDITKVLDAAENDALKIMVKRGIIESEFGEDC